MQPRKKSATQTCDTMSGQLACMIGMPRNRQATESVRRMSESTEQGTNVSHQTAFTVKTWMVTVAIAVVGQLGASIWLAATLTANQQALDSNMKQLARRVDAAASATYTTADAQTDKSMYIRMHDVQAERIDTLKSEINQLVAQFRSAP